MLAITHTIGLIANGKFIQSSIIFILPDIFFNILQMISYRFLIFY